MSLKPYILTTFEEKNGCYASIIQQILEEVGFCDGVSALPLLKIKPSSLQVSVFLLTPFRLHAFSFFSEMLCRALLPGKKIESALQFSLEFSLPEIAQEPFLGGEVVMHVSQGQLQQILRNFEQLLVPLKEGLLSEYRAQQILEGRGYLLQNKMALIEERIRTVIKARPHHFDYDALTAVQQFSALTPKEWQQKRSFQHISRIVGIQYLFQKALKTSEEAFPKRRYVSVKVLQSKKVLSLVIGFSFLKEQEVFEEKHVALCVRGVYPFLNVVEGSFLHLSARHETAKVFYVELENSDASSFTLEMVKRLKFELPQLLQQGIEERVSPLFIRDNEEEIFRHILVLGEQLQSVRDLPQVVIHFHKQTADSLEFMIVIARVKRENGCSCQELFQHKSTQLHLTHNRTKILSTFRKKTQKEAAVFQCTVNLQHFLRQGHVVDLYRAREWIASELSKVIGPFRDYNGGVISKESELLMQLKAMVGGVHSYLLENFFFSLRPAVMRSILSPEPLKTLFHMVVELKNEELEQKVHFRTAEDEEYFYVLLITKDESLRKKVLHFIENYAALPLQPTTFQVETMVGVLARNHDKVEARLFRHAIESVAL